MFLPIIFPVTYYIAFATSLTFERILRSGLRKPSKWSATTPDMERIGKFWQKTPSRSPEMAFPSSYFSVRFTHYLIP